MKTFHLVIALMAAAAVTSGTLAGTGADHQNPADRELGELKNQVNELQTQIRQLEERLNRLESAANREQQEPAPPPAPVPLQFPSILMPPSTGRPRPEIWGERQINGWTFYVVPCETGPKFSPPAPAGSR